MRHIPCHVHPGRLLFLCVWLIVANLWLFFHIGRDIKTPLISVGSTTALIFAFRHIMRSIGSTSWQPAVSRLVTRFVRFLTYRQYTLAPLVLTYAAFSLPMAFSSSVWTRSEISIHPLSLGVDRSPRLVDGRARSVLLTTPLGRNLEISTDGMTRPRKLYPVIPLIDDSHTWTRRTTILLVSPTVVGDLGDNAYLVIYRGDEQIFRFATAHDPPTRITGSFVLGPASGDRTCMRTTDDQPEFVALAWSNPVALDPQILDPLPTDTGDAFTFRIVVAHPNQPEVVAAEYASYIPREACTLLMLRRVT